MHYMYYKEKEFKTFEEIFNYALRLANNNKKSEADELREAYINYILEDASDVSTYEEAEKRMIRNFGYYAGYYDDDIRKLMNKYYGAVHPIFGNKYNISPKEAYELGKKLATGIK